MDEVVAYTQTVAGVTKRYYPHYNHLYSVAALTGGNTEDMGQVVERYTYTAYGKQTITSSTGTVRQKSAVGFDRGFTGYITDSETGLLHARYRYYSAIQGRFISRDPIGYVDGLSLYRAYFAPNSLDPLGLSDAWGWTKPKWEKAQCQEKSTPGGCTPSKKYWVPELDIGFDQHVEQSITQCKPDPANPNKMICRTCQRTDANKDRTQQHENWHKAKGEQFEAQVKGGLAPRYDSLEACTKAIEKALTDFNALWNAQGEPNMPSKTEVQEIAESDAAGKCGAWSQRP